MARARYTTSKHGKAILICEENYHYHSASKSGTKTHFTCVERKTIYRLVLCIESEWYVFESEWYVFDSEYSSLVESNLSYKLSI